ncbi:MAG: heme-dependent oxidative N-demethylase subunit alpha family protein [Caldimonas sp.]
MLGAFTGQALAAVPGFDPMPALRALAHEARLEAPAAFIVDDCCSKTRWHAPRIGWSIGDSGPCGSGDEAIGSLLAALPEALRPTALLCLAFEEDFAVIDGATALVPWLAVCLPSRWAPETKVGRHFAEIHAPVADSATLVAAGASLARLVTGGERWERFVWTLSPDGRLHQHPARDAWPWSTADAALIGATAFFRSERQTFIPVPTTPQAVFTIHVDTLRLDDPSFDAEAARRVHDALASMSPAVLAYRGLSEAQADLLAWLAARAKGDSSPHP